MRILLFGATGLLGQALTRAAARRGDTIVGVARHGANRTVDLTISGAIKPLVAAEKPDLVINAAALTNLDACEADPKAAHAINADAVGAIADACRDLAIRFVHVSTDHFFTGDRDRPHDEGAKVDLVNAYARPKFPGEAQAMRSRKRVGVDGRGMEIVEQRHRQPPLEGISRPFEERRLRPAAPAGDVRPHPQRTGGAEP